MTYATVCTRGKDKKLPNLPHISVLSCAKHAHHFLPVNDRCWSETTRLLQHLFCHANDYYSSPLYHHLQSAARPLVSLLFILLSGMRHGTDNQLQHIHFGLLTTSGSWSRLLLQWYPPYCIIRRKKLQRFWFCFLSTEQLQHNPDSKFRQYNLNFMPLLFTCIGLISIYLKKHFVSIKWLC